MKKVYSLTITLFLLVMMTATLSSQTFYRSVADVDSFAYVTMNDKLLVLQRDSANDLKPINAVNSFQNYRNNKYNSQVIINDFLIVSSLDSLALFSISERSNPVEIDRIYLGNIHFINRFGNYCFVYMYGATQFPLIKIENDNLVIINYYESDSNSFDNNAYLSQAISLTYPRIYKRQIGESVEVYHYSDSLNQFTHVNSILHPNIVGIVSNSTYLFTMVFQDGFPYGNKWVSRYLIQDDSLHFINSPWNIQSNNGITEGWGINDVYGIWNYLYIANTGQLSGNNGSPGPSNYITNIVGDTYNNPFYFKNSVYRIGQNNFYYLHQLVGMSMTFKQFMMPTLPAAPNLVSPIDNETINGDTVNFIWSSASPSITSYEINISTDSMFTTFIDTVVVDTFLTMTDLQMDEKYFWRVRAKNIIGWGNYSSIRKFTTTITGIEDIENKFEFILEQNYPNPFNPSTKISWQSPVGSHQTLKVYDVLGREVATLVDGYRDAGSYEVEFDGSRLASGVYYYQLRSENYSETKKMVVLK